MKYQADNTLISDREMFVELFNKIGTALAAPIMAMVARSPRYAAVEKLNRTSDAELASKGLTRAQVAEQLFRHDG